MKLHKTINHKWRSVYREPVKLITHRTGLLEDYHLEVFPNKNTKSSYRQRSFEKLICSKSLILYNNLINPEPNSLYPPVSSSMTIFYRRILYRKMETTYRSRKCRRQFNERDQTWSTTNFKYRLEWPSDLCGLTLEWIGVETGGSLSN